MRVSVLPLYRKRDRLWLRRANFALDSILTSHTRLRDPASGEMKGVGFDLGKELARRMEVPFEPVLYRVIEDLIAGAKSGEWDVAFVGTSPARAKEMDFTGPALETEVGYLVPSGSSISTSADVDRSGIRVGVPEKSQADSVLSRTLKNAELVRGPGLASVSEMLKSGKVDVFAANKANLFEMSDQLPGSKVLDGRFAAPQLRWLSRRDETAECRTRANSLRRRNRRGWSKPRSRGLDYAAPL